jgi:RimJ/RimL family protein N-acetyltransferase
LTVDVPVLVGEKTRLRPVTFDDVPALLRWFTDPDVIHWFGASDQPPVTAESLTADLEAELGDASFREFILETLDGQPIGYFDLRRINPTHRNAQLFVAIGEADYRGAGYGTDALRTLLRYAFDDLDLRRVYLQADADNARGIRCYEKCGFVHEGVLRQHRVRHGQPLDMVYMAVLRTEWNG